MRFSAAVLTACALLLQTPAHAEGPSDPLSWLGRIQSAGQRLNYVGTFVYQSGGHVETSRVAHRVDAAGALERLEVLDGSPREVIRSNNEVRCVLPDQKVVIIDEAGGRRAFPARLPASFAGLAENYRIRKGETTRVAGYETQQIVLEPRDDLRFGHQLWAEQGSGLLLKARMVDGQGQVIEQFTFSEVRIGNVERAALAPRYRKDEEWRVVNTRGSEVSQQDAGWKVGALPGFELTSVVRRPLGGERGDQAAHELDVAVDVAFELGAQDADMVQHVRALVLLEHGALLTLRQHPCGDDHRKSENSRYIRLPNEASECPATL